MWAQGGVTCLAMLNAVASTRRNVGRGRQAPITQASEGALPTLPNAGHGWPQRLRQAAFFSRKLERSPMPREKIARSQRLAGGAQSSLKLGEGQTMSVLKVRCPETGREISTGIEIDPESFAALPDKLPVSNCPLCGLDHAWLKCDARFVEDPSASGLPGACMA